MDFLPRPIRITGAIGCAAFLAIGAACGAEQKSNAAARPPVAAAQVGAAGAMGAAHGPAAAITIVGSDNKWDKNTLTVMAGHEVTLTLENKGQALYNLRVQGVKGGDGKDITTQLLTGGKSEVISFTIEKPGTYEYVCDVHPVEMKGKLTVQ